MDAIYKYKLNNNKHSLIEMPVGAEIIKCDVQNEIITLWAIVDKDNIEETETRYFHIIATGEYFDKSRLQHIETVFIGPYVWHVFEEY